MQNAWVPQQPSYMMPSYMRQQSSQLVPMGGAPYPTMKPAMPKRRTPEEEAEEAARVARHRERQRKKRNFGRAVRYQVCRQHSFAVQPTTSLFSTLPVGEAALRPPG